MARSIVILVYDDFGFLDAVGPADVFTTAGQLAGRSLYTIQIATVGRRQAVRAESGMRLGVDVDSRTISRVHTLLIVGGLGVHRLLDKQLVIREARRLSQVARRVTSVCTGAWILAAAGLLDGRRATTHWAHTSALSGRFPAIDVVSDELYVRSGKFITAAGVAAGIDLALALVADDHGETLARQTSQRMLLYLNRAGGQSQFSERYQSPPSQDDPFESLLATLAARPTGNLGNAALAERLGISERHLARRFRQRLNTTPARWVERVRVDAAREVLEQSAESLDCIASSTGFQSTSTMRQAFQRVLGISPGHYRALHRSATIEV